MNELQTSFPLEKQPTLLDMMQQSQRVTGLKNLNLGAARQFQAEDASAAKLAKLAQLRSQFTNPQTGKVDRGGYQGALNVSGMGAEADADQAGQYEMQQKKLESTVKAIDFSSRILGAAADHPEYRQQAVDLVYQVSESIGGKKPDITADDPPEKFKYFAAQGLSYKDKLQMDFDNLKEQRLQEKELRLQGNSDRDYELNVYKAKNPLTTYSYTTDSGENVTARDTRNPANSVPVSGQGGMVNIFNPGQHGHATQSNISPKTAQIAQENELKKVTEAKESLTGIESKRAKIITSANNLADYMTNLDKYEKEVGGNPLADNAMAYKSRAAMGTSDTINNLESTGWNFVQDAVRSMKYAGIAPGQMMNTEKEAERFKASLTGGGTAKSMRESINRFSRTQKLDLMAIEEGRKIQANLAGVPYEPLINADMLPGPKLYNFSTEGFKIGQELMDEKGKKFRVSGPNIIELVE